MYSKRVKSYAYATNSTTADPWLYLYRWGPTYPMTTEDGNPLRSPAYEVGSKYCISGDKLYKHERWSGYNSNERLKN
ncbi:hypothetical protein MASR1M46_19640 [Bacteroidales bacterium]